MSRFYIDLPFSKEISYADLIESHEGNQDLMTEDSSSESCRSYSHVMRELINRGETYGIFSKGYKYKKNSVDIETDTQSKLSSFIDSDTEISSVATEEFYLAVDEGFYVLGPDEFISDTQLKRNRVELYKNSEEVQNKILQVEEFYKTKNFTQIPKRITIILLEIQDLIKNNENFQSEVYKKLGKITGLGSNKVIQHLQRISDKKKKFDAMNNYQSKLKSFKKLVVAYCGNGKTWGYSLETKYKELVEALINYVQLNNYFSTNYDNEIGLLDLNSEKNKIHNEIEKLGGRRTGNSSQPIEIISQEPVKNVIEINSRTSSACINKIDCVDKLK